MNFGFLIFPGLEELDLIGPWEMISSWSKYAAGPENCLMVAQSLDPVVCDKGMSINPHFSFSNCPTLDFLLVPGGQGTRREVDNPVLVDFVAEQAEHCHAVLSVCTGTFILHRAGLLTNRKATTHWASLDRLKALDDVAVVEDRVVQDGKVWTSSGVSAGIDLALAFIEHMAGEKTAGRIQLGTEYYPSGKSYGMMHELAQAPVYVKQWYQKK
ncbi:MAG: DJ-1/PfpI family protein [Methanothrix sp.]|nr:DJ-1/PfpI family protein [Methanothrix sp.]